MKTIEVKKNPKRLDEIVSQISSSPYFQEVEPPLLKEVFSSAKIVEVDKDEPIIQQGAKNDSMVYILVEGAFEVFRDGNSILKINRIGQTIGEMAAVSNTADRSADVIAMKTSIVVAIDTSFLHTKSPDDLTIGESFLMMFTRVLAEKIRTTTERAKLYEDSVLENKEIEEYSQELKREIQQKLEQIKLYSQVVEFNQDATLVVDIDGNIQQANHAFFDCFHYEKEDVTKITVENLFSSLVESGISFQEQFSSGWKGERDAIKKDQSTFPAFISISPITSVQNNQTTIIAYAFDIRDITLQKGYENNILAKNKELQRTYQELENTVNDLEKSNRVKDEFLANMSSQLKTPIVSINNHAEMLERELQENQISSASKEHLNQILEEKMKLETMVGNLLSMAELSSNTSSFSMELLEMEGIRKDLRKLGGELGKGLQLNHEQKRFHLKGDKNKLVKAFSEILLYLDKHSKNKTIQWIVEQNKEIGSIYMVFFHGDYNAAKEELKSSQEVIPEGFEYSLQKGDINLPLAKRIIELHKGELRVLGEENEEKIYISLPLDSDQEIQSFKVVIIDEVESDRLIYHGIIKELYPHAMVYEFADQLQGANALTAINPELVLLDPSFHDEQWDYLLYTEKIVGANSDKGAIVVVSELLNDYEVRNNILEFGITDFISKPYTAEDAMFKIQSIINVRQKVSQLSSSVVKAEKSAVTDGMTGLFNRKYYDKFIEEQFMKSEIQGGKCSVIMTDVDNFKNYNDTNGHQLGDEVLKKIASLLKQGVRESDMVARYGGEEFVVVLPGTSKNMALIVAEKLRSMIEESEFPNENTQPLGMLSSSFGVATFPENGSNPEELLKGADHCLYLAKEKGRNTVVGAEGIVKIDD